MTPKTFVGDNVVLLCHKIRLIWNVGDSFDLSNNHIRETTTISVLQMRPRGVCNSIHFPEKAQASYRVSSQLTDRRMNACIQLKMTFTSASFQLTRKLCDNYILRVFVNGKQSVHDSSSSQRFQGEPQFKTRQAFHRCVSSLSGHRLSQVEYLPISSQLNSEKGACVISSW